MKLFDDRDVIVAEDDALVLGPNVRESGAPGVREVDNHVTDFGFDVGHEFLVDVHGFAETDGELLEVHDDDLVCLRHEVVDVAENLCQRLLA